MKVWILMVEDTLLGVYTSEGAAKSAQEKYYELYGQDQDIIWVADDILVDQDQF